MNNFFSTIIRDAISGAHYRLCCLCAVILTIGFGKASAQDVAINPALLNSKWTAQWISCPGVVQRGYGIYHFRKTIKLAAAPAKFIVHLSGDNRYRFFVNGKPVCMGPARGDLYNWYFESVDIAHFLKPGDNVLAALVWNMGEHAPVAQVSNQTGFVLQGDGDVEQIANTNNSWLALHDTAYTPCSTDNGSRLKTYFVIGPGDDFNAANYPWGWEQIGYDDTKWKPAIKVATASPFGYGTDNLWTLVPRTIPHMEVSLQRMKQVRRSEGVNAGNAFLNGKSPLTIPAGKTVSTLIDQSVNTVAYPELIMSKGKNAVVKITYAESLFDKDGQKHNRNEIDHKTIAGNYDIFHPDGGNDRIFRPLWQRTYRYLQLDITTANEPLVLNDLYGMFTAYPLVSKASFNSSDTSLSRIWDVGWRTARLCAGENYFDCPYYEQLQYVADTRIQALISLYVSGDDRLMRKAISDFNHSRVPEGLTQGRYPSNRLQVIPPFSLFWVSMLYDYMMLRDDDAFVKQYLNAADNVLDWYEQRIDNSRQMLGPMKWWNFVDWSPRFEMGVPPGATDGNSSVITLQYVYTLQQAARLMSHFGREEKAAHYSLLADKLNKGTYASCFDPVRGLMGDTPDKQSFSQHAGIMAVLSGAIRNDQNAAVMQRVLSDTSLSQATFYYRFYLAQAMKMAGMGEQYYAQLTPWRDMLKTGLTTFAENPDPSRSDCHAWSASPNYDFLATICGITPSSAGFRTVDIKPQLGALSFASGKMPTPHGELSVRVDKKGATGASVVVTLPKGVTGRFIWKDKIKTLKEGKTEFTF